MMNRTPVSTMTIGCRHLGVVMVLCAALAWPVAGQAMLPYAAMLRDKPLVEGLGFEGAITVFDEVKRMHRRLGRPSTKGDLYYLYDGAGYRLEVFGAYREGRFDIDRIRYSADKERRIVTDTGFRIGVPIAQIIDAHGKPTAREGQEYIWKGRGVSYRVGAASTVVAITVFRPDKALAPKRPKPEPGVAPSVPTPVTPTPTAAPAVKAMSLADIGLSIPLGDWQVTRQVSESGAAFETRRGFVTLDITTCTECAEVLGDAAKDREAKLGRNRLPGNQRKLVDADAKQLGVDAGYLGVYADATLETRTWMWVLRKGRRGWLITMTLTSARPSAQELRYAAEVIRDLKIIAPE